jgi:entericidin B
MSRPDRPERKSKKGIPMLKKLILALTVGSLALGATACNTVRGAGEDLDSAADAVDKEV